MLAITLISLALLPWRDVKSMPISLYFLIGIPFAFRSLPALGQRGNHAASMEQAWSKPDINISSQPTPVFLY
jgi:hypothetical protein